MRVTITVDDDLAAELDRFAVAPWRYQVISCRAGLVKSRQLLTRPAALS